MNYCLCQTKNLKQEDSYSSSFQYCHTYPWTVSTFLFISTTLNGLRYKFAISDPQPPLRTPVNMMQRLTRCSCAGHNCILGPAVDILQHFIGKLSRYLENCQHQRRETHIHINHWAF